MEQTFTKFSELVDTMREAVSNTSRLAKGDTLTDIVTIAREYEQCREAGIERSFVYLDYYWGVRHNGTALTSSKKVVDGWLDSFKNEVVALYKIIFRDGVYTIRLVTSFDDGDIIFSNNN